MKIKTNRKIDNSNKILELIDDLRDAAIKSTPTRFDKVPDEEDISKSKMDDVFDIDIFFSRKPGMRRSVQLISSEAGDRDSVKLSCLTALASLCDTMIANKLLNVSEEDIVKFMVGWLDFHNIKVFDKRSNN